MTDVSNATREKQTRDFLFPVYPCSTLLFFFFLLSNRVRDEKHIVNRFRADRALNARLDAILSRCHNYSMWIERGVIFFFVLFGNC